MGKTRTKPSFVVYGVRGRVRALGWCGMSCRRKSGDVSPHSKIKNPFRFSRKGHEVLFNLELIDQVKRQHIGVVMGCAALWGTVEGIAVFDVIPSEFHPAQHIRP